MTLTVSLFFFIYSIPDRMAFVLAATATSSTARNIPLNMLQITAAIELCQIKIL